VDGKSPVEYLTKDSQREVVRGVARTLLQQPVERLGDVKQAWRQGLRR